MFTNQSIITDIKAIIAQSKDKALRAVDHQRTLMYWQIGKRIFEENRKGKNVQIMEAFLSNIFQTNCNLNLEVDFLQDKSTFIASFTGHLRMCIHCMHN